MLPASDPGEVCVWGWRASRVPRTGTAAGIPRIRPRNRVCWRLHHAGAARRSTIMRYHALVCDYDGTVAKDGILEDPTRRALERLRAAGRKVILATGRRLEDLKVACADLSVFDVVVGENGAILYWPATNEVRTLAEAPPPAFAERLTRLGVREVAVGRVIVATWQPYELLVLDAIRDLGLELQVIFNKGAVMVLPTGVNKGTGVRAALEALHLSGHDAVGVGDAENDHALLAACECGVAVANALPILKQRADWVTTAERGAGVAELAERLLVDDLAWLEIGRAHV